MLKHLQLFIKNNKGRQPVPLVAAKYFAIKAAKLLKFSFVFSWNTGLKNTIKYNPGCTISEKCFILGLYDYDNQAFIIDYISPEDVFFDIGANVAPFSVLAGSKGATVYAFEPCPSTASRAKVNFSLNNLPQTHVLDVVVDSSSGEVFFTDEEGSATNKISENNGRKVRSISVDDSVMEIPSPSFVKIDTEGNEFSVISGMKKCLSERKIRFISFEANGLSSKQDLMEIRNILMENGFSIGLLDYERKVFQQYVDLGEKSPTGDYVALNAEFLEKIQQDGYEVKSPAG